MIVNFTELKQLLLAIEDIVKKDEPCYGKRVGRFLIVRDMNTIKVWSCEKVIDIDTTGA